MIVNKLKNREYYEAYICKKCGMTYMKQVILGKYCFTQSTEADEKQLADWLTEENLTLCPRHAKQYKQIMEHFIASPDTAAEEELIDIHFVIDGEDGYVTVPRNMSEESVKAMILDDILDEPMEIFERE